MRKLLSLLFGLSIGAALGALLVTFFSPVSSSEFRENWQAHIRRSVESGHKASAERRAELEKELDELRNKSSRA